MERARQLDALEGDVWSFVGVPLDAAVSMVDDAEAKLLSTRSVCAESLIWRLDRARRAVANGWSEEAAAPLFDSLERDLREVARLASLRAPRQSGAPFRLAQRVAALFVGRHHAY
jgi:hypothetical protein